VYGITNICLICQTRVGREVIQYWGYFGRFGGGVVGVVWGGYGGTMGEVYWHDCYQMPHLPYPTSPYPWGYQRSIIEEIGLAVDV